MNAARQREDDVLNLVSRHLGWRVIDRPEHPSTQYPGLSTDAVLEDPTSGQRWAVDVTATADDPRAVDTADAAEQYLRPLAQQFGVRIHFQIARGTRVRALQSTLQQQMAADPASGTYEKKGVSVTWGGPYGAGSLDGLIVPTEPTPTSATLSEQIAATVYPTAVKKARQKERAHGLALPYCLVFDSLGHPDIRQGTHWLPQHDFTFRQGIQFAYSRAQFLPDMTLLVWKDGSVIVVEAPPAT